MSSIRDEMPILARHEGDWTGTYTLIDTQGNILDQHDSHLTCQFPEDNLSAYYQINRYQWANGKREEHQFPGIYREKKLWFDMERIQGCAWEADAATILLRFAYKTMPDTYLYEMIQISPCNNYRSRTWHWFKNHQVFRRTLIQEERDEMNQSIKRAFLNTEDGQILYRIGGEGDPLLLLHMNPRSSDEFRELMPIFVQKRQAIAMDLMGFGDSDKPPRMYTVADYAKTIIALLDELGLENISILGNHTGAFVAGEVAVAYPERLNKLILCNVAGFGEEGKADLSKRFEEGFKIKEDGSYLMERWLARARYVGSAELNHRWVLDDLKCFGYPLYAVWAVGNYCLDAAERFSLIKCPTLILWGIDDVEEFERLGLAKAKDRFFLTTAIPHGKVVDLVGGTICMMNQMPEKIAKVVVKFLEEIEE